MRTPISHIESKLRLERDLSIQIFTEGDFDSKVVRWYCKEFEISDATVYPISQIDVPDTVLYRYGLTFGSNRNRVTALMHHLKDRIDALDERAIFIVDSDFDLVLGRQTIDGLSYTDFSNMGMYFWDESKISTFLEFVASGQTSAPSEFISDLRRSLRYFSSAKIFLKINELSVSLGNINKFLVRNETRFSIDSTNVASTITKDPSHNLRFADITYCINQIDESLTDSFENYCSDHDLYQTIYWYATNRRSSNIKSYNAIMDIFLVSMSCKSLLSHPLFQDVATTCGIRHGPTL